ncbi:MAG: hypothetical protein RJB60_2116 [Pseudomonadota bacterium]|jgi:hypothetical protein
MSLQLHRSIRPFSLSIAAALALSACGGGGGSDTPAAVAGTQTGVFVDSAVEGLSYETSSGVKGTTDAQGRFKYNEGDTVTFKAGGVTLGSGKATGTVTPAHISGGEDTNKFTNLLVLLQSLDTDGDPSNGITLPANLDGTKLAKVAERLNDDPADFTDDSKNVELKQASPKGAIRKRDEARKHYEDTQAKVSDFMDGAAGVWVGRDMNNRTLALRLTPSGRYMLTIISSDAENGTEIGTLARDAATGLITTSNITTDTNGTAGWSNLGADRTVALSFEARPEERNYTSTLTVTVTLAGQEPMTIELQHPAQRKGSLMGAWSTSPDLRLNAPLVLFNGRGSRGDYAYIAPEATGGECAAGAVEGGSFTYAVPVSIVSVSLSPPQATPGPTPTPEPTLAPAPVLTFGKSSLTYEGCNFFLKHQGFNLNPRLSEDGLTLTVYDTSGETVLFKLYRIKRDKDWFQEEWDSVYD